LERQEALRTSNLKVLRGQKYLNKSIQQNDEQRGQILALQSAKKENDQVVSRIQRQLVNVQSKLLDPSDTHATVTTNVIDPTDIDLLLNVRIASEHGVLFNRALMCPGWLYPISCVTKFWPNIVLDPLIARTDRHPCVYQHCANKNPYTSVCCSCCTLTDNTIQAFHPNCLKSHK